MLIVRRDRPLSCCAGTGANCRAISPAWRSVPCATTATILWWIRSPSKAKPTPWPGSPSNTDRASPPSVAPTSPGWPGPGRRSGRHSRIWRRTWLGEALAAARDAVNGAFDSYVSHRAHRSNRVIKVLTLVSTLLLPTPLIVSLFGVTWAPASRSCRWDPARTRTDAGQYRVSQCRAPPYIPAAGLALRPARGVTIRAASPV